jgi:hypothetical protein
MYIRYDMQGRGGGEGASEEAVFPEYPSSRKSLPPLSGGKYLPHGRGLQFVRERDFKGLMHDQGEGWLPNPLPPVRCGGQGLRERRRGSPRGCVVVGGPRKGRAVKS